MTSMRTGWDAKLEKAASCFLDVMNRETTAKVFSSLTAVFIYLP